MSAKSSVPNDNVAVVRRLYEAHGNPEVIRQVLAPDVCWEVVAGFPHSDVYHGLSGVVDFFTRLSRDFEEWRTEPSEFFEIGDRVIAIGTYSARAKATGKTFKAQFAHVWTLRDGVIVRLQQCADTAQLAKALGKNFQRGSDMTDVNPIGEHGKDENEATGVNDFDFLTGSWRVHHRRLKERLADNHDWIEFEGRCTMQKILGGAGNMDENLLDFPAGAYRAVTLRTHDVAQKQWSIWWIDGRNPSHVDPPVVGGFKDGVGTFYADDTFEGKSIRIRFLWTNLTTKPRWE